MKHLIALFLMASTAPALAHPGDHAGLDLLMLTRHFFEPDHIIFAMLAGAVGVLAYRAGRKAEAKAQRQEHRHDPR